MKILAIGDFHGKFPEKLKKEVKKADLVLVTGDFGGSDRLLKIIFKYLVKGGWYNYVSKEKAKEYISEDYNSGVKILNELNKFEKRMYLIAGNWDFIKKTSLDRTAKLKLIFYPKVVRRKLENLRWWNRGIKKNVNGLKILAFGDSVTPHEHLRKGSFSHRKWKKHVAKNKKEISQIMSYGAKDIDILFAHYTPYKIFDKVKWKGYNPMNGKHVGFEGFTKYIKKYSPRLFISGHMHEYQGIKKLGKTIIVATGAAKDGKAAMIDFNEKTKKFKVSFIKP